ncbi:peptide synthetase [Acinetobacter sp. S40]|uniref:condensation domain-containing protein n=1 Tax=Acinetobacter sp. S40 TaxID=2767434 RepID=UPI00190A98D3|nr:condensation domain-containing protein [Acinetobacter sp. S40]MBJ9986748.1 peptide synthetase [Acinetobacter sp. S40]
MQLRQEITAQIHQVLQVDGIQIQPEDNLIEHGLHSLAIMQLVDHFEKKYNTSLSYADFAMSPTVQDWHQLIQDITLNTADSDLNEATKKTSTLSNWLQHLPTNAVPLSDMQYAYWAGRETEGVSAHLYMEFEGKDLDIPQLQCAFEQLIQRHPMLSASIREGQQSIKSIEHQQIQIEDLTQLNSADIEAHLKAKRECLSHQQLNIAHGYVLDVKLSLLPEQRHILHLDSDMSAIDPQSFLIVVEDLSALYRGEKLTDLNLDGVDYFNYLNQRRDHVDLQAQIQQDQQWWQSQLDTISPPPQLPVVAEGLRADQHHFERLIHIFHADERARLQSLAQMQGVSVRSVCLSLFAQSIANWSSTPEFRLNLPAFIRESDSQNINHVVGDFTQISLLSLKLNGHESLLDTVKRIERDVDQIYEYYRYGGIHVLRDLSKHRQQLEVSPIVFTSALDEGEIFSEQLQSTLGQPVWCISQGPKVDLDVQIAYFNQGLAINWDIRTHAFKSNVIQGMFDHYIQLIQHVLTVGSPAFAQTLNALSQYTSQLIQSQNQQQNQVKAPLTEQILAKFPKAHANTPYRILNGLEVDCPAWVLGRLVLNLDDANSNARYPSDQSEWIDIGVQAYIDDQGQLHLFEHSHQLILKNGQCIEVQSIEAQITKIACVQQVKVYAVEKQGKSVIVAVLTRHQQLSSSDLHAAYTNVLPQYLIPEQSYVVSDLQPFTAHLSTENLHHFMATHVSIEYAQPRPVQSAALENVVTFIMTKIIGLPQQQANSDLDFFDEGGDSLLATHLVAALNQYFKDAEISVVDIFTQRNATNIARLIEQKLPDTAQRIAEVFMQVIEGK